MRISKCRREICVRDSRGSVRQFDKICNASIDCPCFAKPDFAEQGCRYISREYKTHNIEIYVTYYHTYYTMVDLRVSAENRRRSRKDTILFIMTKKVDLQQQLTNICSGNYVFYPSDGCITFSSLLVQSIICG